ncbi:unnamed protein product [Bursaphelenchus xylophilus]|uniref:General transcription and DNA repair factor IIH subunit TFB5 n=1 Tax=Bursaphelenchus xylophilus TaxID=6326 RepID=A0A1I7S1U1_BURXY|nr:unnamed protein product [Bursaphelenchus xylophilus]CAG9089949.1 unnamed protein product [Bursaphelenchus xylophilus]
MVNMKMATLITCDPAMLQLIRHMDKTQELSYKFIIKQLDETHILVDRDAVTHLKQRVDSFMDQLSPDQVS